MQTSYLKNHPGKNTIHAMPIRAKLNVCQLKLRKWANRPVIARRSFSSKAIHPPSMRWFTRYWDRIYAMVNQLLRNSQDAEEVTQDAFIRAHRGLVQLPRRIGVLHLALPDRHQPRAQPVLVLVAPASAITRFRSTSRSSADNETTLAELIRPSSKRPATRPRHISSFWFFLPTLGIIS